MSKILTCGIHYWIAGGFMLALVLLENRYLTPSALATCVMIGSGGLMYLAVLCIMRDEFFLSNMRFIWRQVIKRE